MIEMLLDKVLIMFFILAILNCVYHVWNIINNLKEEIPKVYKISKIDRLFIGISISYIITSIIQYI